MKIHAENFTFLKLLNRCWKILKQYLGNCSIHGLKYLVVDEYSYVEKIFWLIACVLSWWGCSSMVSVVLRSYFTGSVAVTLETNYVDWQTPFPSLILCYRSVNDGKNYATEILKKDKIKRLPDIFNAYDFGFTCKPSSAITADELLRFYEEMRIPCNEIFSDCKWNKRSFNCCEEFQEYKTGVGFCLAINSYQTRKSGERLRFYVNRTMKYGTMQIDLAKHVARQKNLIIYLMNNQNLPTINTRPDEFLSGSNAVRADVVLKDIRNDNAVQNVPEDRRKCRFSYEITKNSMFSVYSTESCALEIYIKRMIEICGCVNFYYPTPHGARTCNMNETKCLYDNKDAIKSLTGIRDICYPECDGTEIDIDRQETVGDEVAPEDYRITLRLLQPTLRYYRYVTQSLLDVVVSIGSAIGLFMGASILSLFEIPYWFIVRRDKID